MTRRWSFGVLAVFGVLAACDGQAGPDYSGEPLATIRGTIVSDAPTRSAPLDVTLLWLPVEDGGANLVGRHVTISGELPAAFELDLFEPPPAGYLSLGDAELGIPAHAQALIVVAPQGLAPDQFPAPGSLYGVSDKYRVMYLIRAVDAGSAAATRLGGAVEAGYHVAVPCAPEDPPLGDCFRPAPDDLETEILLELGIVP